MTRAVADQLYVVVRYKSIVGYLTCDVAHKLVLEDEVQQDPDVFWQVLRRPWTPPGRTPQRTASLLLLPLEDAVAWVAVLEDDPSCRNYVVGLEPWNPPAATWPTSAAED